MRDIILIAHNLRSCHNVGSLLRTAEGLGVRKVWLTGYTPYPDNEHDTNNERLPHIRAKLHRQIVKTALGAESTQPWQHNEDIVPVLARLKADGYQLVGVEQAANSQSLPAYVPPYKVALIIGREVEGLETDILAAVDTCVEIPMYGQKESFNVVQAAAMAMYHCRFYPGTDSAGIY